MGRVHAAQDFLGSESVIWSASLQIPRNFPDRLPPLTRYQPTHRYKAPQSFIRCSESENAIRTSCRREVKIEASTGSHGIGSKPLCVQILLVQDGSTSQGRHGKSHDAGEDIYTRYTLPTLCFNLSQLSHIQPSPPYIHADRLPNARTILYPHATNTFIMIVVRPSGFSFSSGKNPNHNAEPMHQPNARISTFSYPSFSLSRIPHARLRIVWGHRRRVMLPARIAHRTSIIICTGIVAPSAIPIDTCARPSAVVVWNRPRRAHHGWRLGASWLAGLSTSRTAAATEAAAEDGEEEEAADAGADADDEVLVIVDPGADFPSGGRAFALSLGKGGM